MILTRMKHIHEICMIDYIFAIIIFLAGQRQRQNGRKKGKKSTSKGY